MKKPHEAKIKFLPCTGCEAKFKADRSLKQHVNAVHEATIKLFQCTGCEAKFTAENALNNTSMQFMKPRSNCYSAQSVRLHISENRYLTRMITCGHFTC